jgi:hypothetical protein
MPAGIGARQLALVVGLQAPSAGVYANFVYDAPLLTTAAVVAQTAPITSANFAMADKIDADGGTIVQVAGWYLPRPFFNATTYPQALPLPSFGIPPTQSLVVRWASQCEYDAAGAVPAGARCLPPALYAVLTDHSDGALRMVVPPGLGTNRSLRVEIWDATGMVRACSGCVCSVPRVARCMHVHAFTRGYVLFEHEWSLLLSVQVAASNSLFLDYGPPVITTLSPPSIPITNVASNALISFSGWNLGKQVRAHIHG